MRGGQLLAQAPERLVVDAPRGRRPIPPVDHGTGAEIDPVVAALPGLQEDAVAGDLEAQERRRGVEENEIDLTSGGPSQRGLDLDAAGGVSGSRRSARSRSLPGRSSPRAHRAKRGSQADRGDPGEQRA
jgi:hypothetical protein